MSILGSKWTIGLLIPIGIYLILWLFGKKSVQAEVTVNAQIDEVWNALTEADKIKEWNKVLIPVEGSLIENGTIKYQFYQEENGELAVMSANVVELVQSELINQKGGIPSILTFDHRYIITQNAGLIQIKIMEEYRGAMVPFWNPKPVGKAYERLLIQLKTFLENG